jgi:hypothetical protein
VNAQLICDTGDLAMSPALALPDLEHRLHRTFTQLIRALLVCRHETSSFQVWRSPDTPGRFMVCVAGHLGKHCTEPGGTCCPSEVCELHTELHVLASFAVMESDRIPLAPGRQ